jgi:hypothetical protein
MTMVSLSGTSDPAAAGQPEDEHRWTLRTKPPDRATRAADAPPGQTYRPVLPSVTG